MGRTDTKLIVTAAALSLMVTGCMDTGPQPGEVVGSTQQLRAGIGEDGNIFLGLDFLVTDEAGEVIECNDGSLTVDVGISFDGPEGQFDSMNDGSVSVSCVGAGRSDLAFVVDNSGSLDDHLPLLKGAANNAIDSVVADGGRASVVRVSTDSSITLELTNDESDLETAVNDLYVSNGWTALWDGVRMGNETLGGAIAPVNDVVRYAGVDNFCAASRKIGILMFTDGNENNSSHQNLLSEAYPGDGLDTNFEDLQNLRVDGITTPIYSVGMGDEVDHGAMEELADYTGGRHLAVDGPEDLHHVFGLVGEYVQSTHQACGAVPGGRCGPAVVRVKHTWTNGNTVVEGTRDHHINVPCGVRAPGRMVTILLSMSNPDIPRNVTATLASQSIEWATPVDDPKVLVIRDDNHHNEFANDPQYITDVLTQDLGYDVTYIQEPRTGVTLDMLDGYDAVWFSNPGYPMDDEASKMALLSFAEAGGGVVIQGDDMAYSWGRSFSMVPITKLNYKDNGTKYCGTTIDNNRGNKYRVRIDGAAHPVVNGLNGVEFTYGDDIDTSVPRGEGEEVLAWATVDGKSGCDEKPVIVAFTP